VRGPIRRAAVAGSWYPGDGARLAGELDSYLAAVAPVDLPGRLLGLISPHAGLVYSGPVAAHGYALLKKHRVATAVLVGPSHHAAFSGVSLFASGAFETPLGEVPVDGPLADRIAAESPIIRDAPRPHLAEHSLEMQLPFLRHLAPGLQIVPMLIGTQTRETVEALAGALARALPGQDVLLVASSDLSHFNPAPVANQLDGLVVQDIERFEPDRLMARLESSPEHACGGGAIVAVMKACQALGADRAKVLRYGDSGDVGERDKSRVVGYLSAALSVSAA